MGSNRKRYYIVEGETEETFWRYLIESNYVSPGKVKIFNLMQSSLNTTDTLFVNRQAEFFGVLDTDVTDQDNLQKLYKNVLSLRSNGNVKLLMNIPQQVYRLSEKAVPPFRGKCTAYPPRCTAHSLGYDVKII